MSRFMIGAAAVTLLLLSGCSAEENINDSDDLTGQLSDVEIQLSARDKTGGVSLSTRAAIESDEETVSGIGVFGLAREKNLNLNPRPADPIWFALPGETLEDKYETGCILHNVESNKVGNDIVWANPLAHYYYPLTRFYAYDFYGYYPYQATSDLVETPTSVKANYVIDGTMDLLWGRATSTEEYAYSAQYFRRNSENNAKKPSIPLQHLLTRLVFYAVPWESYEGSAAAEGREAAYKMSSLMSVTEVQLVDVYTHCSVTIADKSNLNMALTDRITLTNQTKETLYLRDVDGSELDPVHLPAVSDLTDEIISKGIQVGESMMLYPDSEYTIRLKLTMDGYYDTEKGEDVPGEEFTSEIPLILTFNDENKTFEQGKKYIVKLMVSGPRAVELQATVEDWEEEEGPTILM